MNGDHVEPPEYTFFHDAKYQRVDNKPGCELFSTDGLISDIEGVVNAALDGFTIEKDYAAKILAQNKPKL